MKLGFEETQAAYTSASQRARVWTERWVADWMFCPNCGSEKLNPYENNRPVADFVCPSCKEEYELKSKNGQFGTRIIDGAFSSMRQRLASDNNPSLMLLSYNSSERAVTDFSIVPRHFFIPDIVEERPPLAPTAKRAGWIGCNIVLGKIPATGRIFLVHQGKLLPRESVVAQWRQTLFLRQASLDAKGWLIEVMNCVEALDKQEFKLQDVYGFEARLKETFPNNNNVRPKIRQQLQVLRDHGYLEFVGRGYYRLRK
jgi:type II restriction enzyme